jgi:hypothetical protein
MNSRRAMIGLRLLLGILALASHAGSALAATPDLARERRWADEIVPQLFAGEAVWLATMHQPKVLALYTAPATLRNARSSSCTASAFIPTGT